MMTPLQKLVLLSIIMILFHFYYTYFRITLTVRRRLEPWKKALKNIRW